MAPLETDPETAARHEAIKSRALAREAERVAARRSSAAAQQTPSDITSLASTDTDSSVESIAPRRASRSSSSAHSMARAPGFAAKMKVAFKKAAGRVGRGFRRCAGKAERADSEATKRAKVLAEWRDDGILSERQYRARVRAKGRMRRGSRLSGRPSVRGRRASAARAIPASASRDGDSQGTQSDFFGSPIKRCSTRPPTLPTPEFSRMDLGARMGVADGTRRSLYQEGSVRWESHDSMDHSAGRSASWMHTRSHFSEGGVDDLEDVDELSEGPSGDDESEGTHSGAESEGSVRESRDDEDGDASDDWDDISDDRDSDSEEEDSDGEGIRDSEDLSLESFRDSADDFFRDRTSRVVFEEATRTADFRGTLRYGRPGKQREGGGKHGIALGIKPFPATDPSEYDTMCADDSSQAISTPTRTRTKATTTSKSLEPTAMVSAESWDDAVCPGPMVTQEITEHVYTPAASGVIDFALPLHHPLRHGAIPHVDHASALNCASAGVFRETHRVSMADAATWSTSRDPKAGSVGILGLLGAAVAKSYVTSSTSTSYIVEETGQRTFSLGWRSGRGKKHLMK